VYAPGKAPVYVPFYRRFAVLPWLLSATMSAVALVLTAFVTGINTHQYPSVAIGSGTATGLAENDVTGDLYAAIDGRQIAKIDPGDKKFSVLATTADQVDDLIVHGTTAYGDSPIIGTVTAVDLTKHRPLWKVRLPPGLKGLALAGDLLVTTVPARGEVIALSIRDGHQVAKQKVQGIPWGVVAQGDQLVVPIVDRRQLAYLTAGSLSPVRTVATVSGPQQILAQGAVLWVLSPTEDRVVRRSLATGADQGQLLLSDPAAMTSSSSRWFAVQGHERVTLVSAAGAVDRVHLPYGDVSSMCVTRDGHLFVGVDGKVAQLR
jgi:hypothetical protein